MEVPQFRARSTSGFLDPGLLRQRFSETCPWNPDSVLEDPVTVFTGADWSSPRRLPQVPAHRRSHRVHIKPEPELIGLSCSQCPFADPARWSFGQGVS
eukprot:scaffold895_cov315-Pinguiococcus_pyrenoidosus.AAC.18